MKSAEELWHLLREASAMPYGAAQIALFDQLLPRVDGVGEAELAYTTRMLATNAYTYGGEPAKGFVTFAWCLSEFDNQPAPYHARMQHTLLWNFKTMVNGLLTFPEVPLDRTRAVLDDMERRYREGGHSLQAVYKKRYQVADHVGAVAEAESWYERWVTAPRDDLSDCVGCDPTSKVRYLNKRGRFADAVDLATPVLAGKLTCTEQPQTILTNLMEPYLLIGRLDDAADAHRRAYRLHRGLLADLADVGTHLWFCARTGNEPRGLELLQRHVDWLETAPSPSAEMNFAADASLLLRRLVEIGHGDATFRLKDRGEIAAEVLAGEFAARATAIAQRFDARNGTTEQSRHVAESLGAEPFGVVLPLSPTSRVRPAATPPITKPAEAPAETDPEKLLELARAHELADRDAELAATLAAFETLVPDPGSLGPRLAARYHTLAGSRVWETDRAATAAHWERAADLYAEAGEPGEASSVRGRVGMIHCMEGRMDTGRALIEDDLAYQQEHDDLRLLAGAWSRLSHVHFVLGEAGPANTAQDRADEAMAQVGDPRMAAVYALRRAQNRAAAHRHDEARAAAAEARDFYRSDGPADKLAMAATLCGQLSSGDDPAESLAAFTEALETGRAEQPLIVRLGRGRALMRLDRSAEAVPELVEAVALSAEQGLDDAGAFARQDLAYAYRGAGRVVEAAEVAEEALTTFERLELEEAANDTRLLLAGLYRQLGDEPGALALYDDLIGRLADNPAGRGQIGEMRGQLLFDVDRDAEAAEAFAQAGADLRATGDMIGEQRLLRRRLIALHYADDVEAGEAVIALAAERFADVPAVEPAAIWGRAMFGFEAGRFLMSRGRYAEAVPHVQAGPAALRGIGATDDADQVEGMYAEALLRSGSPAEAHAVIAPLFATLRPDAPSRASAAEVYADTLDALGRGPQAADLRTREGLNGR